MLQYYIWNLNIISTHHVQLTPFSLIDFHILTPLYESGHMLTQVIQAAVGFVRRDKHSNPWLTFS